MKQIIQAILGLSIFFVAVGFIDKTYSKEYEPDIYETTIEKFLDDSTVLRMDVEIEMVYYPLWVLDGTINSKEFNDDKELFNKIVDRQVELIGTSEDSEDKLLEALNDSFENTELTIKSVDILDITEYYKETSE